MKDVLSLTAPEARDFFLKEESYINFDLPPYFEFGGLLEKVTNHLGDRLLSDFYKQKKKPNECEGVNYKLVKNKDGKYAWRPLQIIHPALYVSLISIITNEQNWKDIQERMNYLIAESRVKCEGLPVVSSSYTKDKAAQIVHWSSTVEKKSIKQSLEYDYLYHTDITDCYGSIYTHSIAWALHGKDKAKKERYNKNLIGNKIDQQVQAMTHGQTNGIPQGSILMDFIAEIVLCYIDKLLTKQIRDQNIKPQQYRVIRYRDDYRIFVNNPQVAEQIIKELTDILNEFGMQVNVAKTTGQDNVITSSIKSDKLHWMLNESVYSDLQSELYSLFVFSQEFPNSGTLVKRLYKVYNDVLELSKKDLKSDVEVLISIISDIAYRNPSTHPLTSAILSKFIDFLPQHKKKPTVNKILRKFKKLPNTGIMQLWLQRITVKMDDSYDYSERLCKKLTDESIEIWNSDWLNKSLRHKINTYSLINYDVLNNLGAVIGKEEVELFKLKKYPFNY